MKVNRMFRQATLLVLFVFSTLATFAQEEVIKKANRLLDEDKKKQAVEVLKGAVAAMPTSENYYYLGYSQIQLGDKAAAKESFNKGISIDAKDGLNYAGLGSLFVLEKKYAEAKTQFDKAIDLAKKNVKVYQAVSEAQLQDKKTYKDALVYLNKAKSINERSPLTHLLLGDYHLMENNGGPAASAYERASELDASDALPWYKLGLLYMRTNNMAVVEENLNKAIKIDANFALAHRELGKFYYLKSNGAAAVKHYEAYLKLTDSPEKNSELQHAFYLFMAKDYTKANEEFKKLAARPDASSTTLRYYAKSLSESGQLDASQKVFEKYMSSKDSLQAVDYANYAELLQKQGKDSLMAIAYEKSIAIDKTQVATLEKLSAYYYKAKRYADCSRTMQSLMALRKQPVSADYYTLGRSLFFEKKYTDSDAAFAKLIELQPQMTLGYLWEARSKSAQDEELKNALAKPFYEKVIEVGEGDKTKNKVDLVQAYQYMGSYHLTKAEYEKAKEFFDKALVLDPNNETIKEAIKLTLQQQQQAKQAQTKKKQ